MKIKKFNELNEENIPKMMFDDIGNIKAMKTWRDKDPDIEFVFTSDSPLNISTLNSEKAYKFRQLLYDFDVKFEFKELQLK